MNTEAFLEYENNLLQVIYSQKAWEVYEAQKFKGNGTCPVTNSQKQTVNCSESKCQVSEWSTWSDCVNGSQTRSRKMISSGNDCPSFIETRICNLNDNNKYTSDITNNTDPLESNKYKWLTDELQNFTKRDLVVVFLILLLFTILLVLYLR